MLTLLGGDRRKDDYYWLNVVFWGGSLNSIVKLRVLSHILVNSWLTPRKVYKMSREDPEIGFVMG